MGNTSSAFSNLWDIATNHSAPLPSTSELAASHSVLDSLKKRRGLETAQWLNRLAGQISLDQQLPAENKPSSINGSGLNQTNPSSITGAGLPAQPSMQQAVLEWLEKMFDHFERYASRFNEKARGTDLIVNYSRPLGADKVNNQDLRDSNGNAPSIDSVYEGHLSTRFWAMLFRGSLGKIEVFVIPAEVLLGFSTHQISESAYSPLLTIESDWQNGQLKWHIAQTVISIEQVPLLAKELFGDLVRVASGQMSESELFAHPMQELSLGENLAIGYQPAVANQLAVPPQANTIYTPIENSNPAADILPGAVNSEQAVSESSISLKSLSISEQLLVSLDADINQLFELGKTALQSENTDQFHKIQTLTTVIGTYKQTVIDVSDKIRQSLEEIEKTSAPTNNGL